MFFRPEGKAVAADVIPFYENNKFKLFYLQDYRDIKEYGEGCPWVLLETEDLVNFTNYGVVLPRGSVDEQDLYVFTGCCVKFNDEYRIYYTGHNPHKRKQGLPEQKILLATSKDMIHWVKQEDFCYEAPEWMEMHDYRDPFVFYNEEKKKYCMLLAGIRKSADPIHYKGGTFIAYSDDGLKWDLDEKPFLLPQAYYTHECPDLFKIGDWWYLIFSEFTDKCVTRYVMSKSLDGPWITPINDTFDGHSFYAAKSISDGKRRILFGWNCIKNNEKDDEMWQWGGTIICNEIVQLPNGELGVKCPEEVKNTYSKPVQLKSEYSLGKTDILEDSITLGKTAQMSIQMFGKLPSKCKIEFDLKTTDYVGDFGLILNENNNHINFYKVKFEPKFNRLTFDKMPRLNNNLHCNVDVERYCPLVPKQTNHVILIIEDSVCEVYVNDNVCMSVRMFDSKNGNFGFYSHNTSICIENLKVFE